MLPAQAPRNQRPERREDLAMGLAQSPTGDNWPYLLRSLSIVEGIAAQEVLNQLIASDRSTDDAEPVRQVILCGLRLGDNGRLGGSQAAGDRATVEARQAMTDTTSGPYPAEICD